MKRAYTTHTRFTRMRVPFFLPPMKNRPSFLFVSSKRKKKMHNKSREGRNYGFFHLFDIFETKRWRAGATIPQSSHFSLPPLALSTFASGKKVFSMRKFPRKRLCETSKEQTHATSRTHARTHIRTQHFSRRFV